MLSKFVDAVKAVLGNLYIYALMHMLQKSKINNLNFYVRKLDKQGQIKSN